MLAGALAELLEQANIGAVPLLIGFMLVILVLDFIMPGSLPKWAIFAPIFVPLFMRLGVPPQTVLAAYRVADSPVNALTPLMVYLPFIVTVAQRYQKKAGIGTVVALMLPYVGGAINVKRGDRRGHLLTAAVGDRAELDLLREGSRSTVTTPRQEAP